METMHSFVGAGKDCVSPFLRLQTQLSSIEQMTETKQPTNDFLRVTVIFLVALEKLVAF